MPPLSRLACCIRGIARRGGETIEAIEQRQRLVRRRATLDGGCQQAPGSDSIAALKRGLPCLQQLLAFPLTLGNGAARAFDVRPRTRVTAIQKQHARPDADGELVLSVEVMVQTGEQQLLDARLAARRRSNGTVVLALRISHGEQRDYAATIEWSQRNSGNMWYRSAVMAIIECIPNVSEGRRAEVIEAIASAIRSVPGVRLLDYSSDASHNRSVFTLAGAAAPLRDAVLAMYERALSAIDLRTHTGEHPRLGAVDVVPFVPIEGVSMEDCVTLANEVAREVASRFEVPVYLYEEASANPARKNLEDIRRGEFEGLAAKMASEGWAPDYGPARPHPSAGASVIGARMPLIAYNINLATDRVDVAKKIAAAIRQSSGGFRFVKAAGFKLEDRGIVQVSMNLTNYEKTPMFRVFEAVKREAERYGVSVLESEIVGLVPAAALNATAAFYLQLEGFKPEQVLENKLRATD